MSFIRKFKRGGRIYLAEVENRRVGDKVVQRFVRYVGKEADGRTVLSTSLSEAEVEAVKLYGPLLVLHHLATEIQLPEQLGDYSQEILSLVYAHCLDYRSLNHMPSWFERTDLNFLLNLEGLTEKRLVGALNHLESPRRRGVAAAPLSRRLPPIPAAALRRHLRCDQHLPLWPTLSAGQTRPRQGGGQGPPPDPGRSGRDPAGRHSLVSQGL